MKRLYPIALSLAALCGMTLSGYADSSFEENFDAGYDRLTQNIAGGNMAVYRSRSSDVATVGTGSLTFSSPTASAGADQFFGYLTDPGNHIAVGVGDTLSVSVSFSLTTVPTSTTYSLRFGLFDDVGLRQTADLNSGGNSAAFTNNPGYALFVPLSSSSGMNNQISIRQRTTLTAGNIFSASADYTQIGSTTGGAYNPLANGVNYTLNFSLFRLDGSTTVLSASIIDTIGLNVMTAGSVTNSGAQLGSFSWMAWRPPQQPDSANGGPITFTDIKYQLTQVPEPSTFALGGLGLVGWILARRRSRR